MRNVCGNCNYIAYYFVPDSKASIHLLLYTKTHNMPHTATYNMPHTA